MALAQIHGKNIKALHPDLERVRKTAGNKLELEFSNVDIRLLIEDPDITHIPFAIRDQNGAAEVEKYSFLNSNTLALELKRPIEGKTIVVGAPGSCPPFMVPFDLCGYLPMLGFKVELE